MRYNTINTIHAIAGIGMWFILRGTLKGLGRFGFVILRTIVAETNKKRNNNMHVFVSITDVSNLPINNKVLVRMNTKIILL